MNHFLLCNNSTCGFLLDVRIDGSPFPSNWLLLHHCPECGSDWSSNKLVSSRALTPSRRAKVPFCPCCQRSWRAKAHLSSAPLVSAQTQRAGNAVL